MDQVLNVEADWIITELNESYGYIYEDWNTKNSNDLASANAAYNAGENVCLKNERLKKASAKSIERGNKSKELYTVIMLI